MSSGLAALLTALSLVPKIIGAVPQNHDQLFALNRDNLGREDPDALLGGFVPVWAIVIFVIAATFLVTSILSGVCYLAGCRSTAANQQKHTVLTNY